MDLADRSRVERLIRERGSITDDTPLRLAKVFDVSPQFWINLKTNHDLSNAAMAKREALAAIKALTAPMAP